MNESLSNQLTTLKSRFDDQLIKQQNFESTISNKSEQIAALEGRIQGHIELKAEADGEVNTLKSDNEDLVKSNKGFEMENMSLVRERVTNLQTIKEINAAYTLE